MLAFQAFHLAVYHFAHGTFQPPAASPALGCSDLDGLLSGGQGPVDLNAALDVCFDRQFSCSHAQVQPTGRVRGMIGAKRQPPHPRPTLRDPTSNSKALL